MSCETTGWIGLLDSLDYFLFISVEDLRDCSCIYAWILYDMFMGCSCDVHGVFILTLKKNKTIKIP